MEDGPLLRLVLIAALFATPVAAQTWTNWLSDNGRLYYGSARYGSFPNQLDIFCGGRSPQNQPFQQGDPNEFPISPPGLLSLEIQTGLLPQTGLNTSGPTVRSDVMIIVGDLGYKLPSLRFDELWGSWIQDLTPQDPLIKALATGQPGAIYTDAGQSIPMSAGNAPQAITAMQEFCAPYLTGTAAPTPAPSGSTGDVLKQAVDREILKGCEGPAKGAAPLLSGDIDRDGQPDYVLDWAEFQCAGALPRPFCGAANCQVQVFLSSKGGEPINYFGISAELKPAPAGGHEIWSYTTAGQCAKASIPDQCANVLRWDGQALARVP